MIKKNAIILAAGKSNRFAPFTYEKPKGLFRVKGEILVERQIEQLREAGVEDICIVVGYMKEKFFYLEDKYGVKLIINNTFASKGNIVSLYAAREYLGNTFICCADHYYPENPFMDDNKDNVSYRLCSYKMGKFREFEVDCSDAGVITGSYIGGHDAYAMVGQAYFNEGFSKTFRMLLEREIDDFGVASMFWEEFYAKHEKQLTLYCKKVNDSAVLEFDSVNDLRRFDSEFLMNVDSEIVTNICKVLGCKPKEINDINVIQAGLTNVSFCFTVNGAKYVYRHPGGTSGNIVNRKSEVYTQTKAKEIGADKTLIYIDEEGWKISHFVENIMECDFEKYPDQLDKAMEYLRAVHEVEVSENAEVKHYDLVSEALRLMKLACATKGNLFVEFADIINKVTKLGEYVKEDMDKYGMKYTLCHNDVYEPNFLATSDGGFYLIDWEFGGINDPASDICGMLCRYYYTDEQIEFYLKKFFGRELTYEEHRHYIAFIPICGFYFFCWSLYKGSAGEEDGFFFLQCYRTCNRFLDKAIASYESEQ